MAEIVDYHFAKQPQLPPMPASLYQYVVGSNGIFVRARRPGLEALIWVAASETVRGLAKIEPYVRIGQRVPAAFVHSMLSRARLARPNEIMFYMVPGPGLVVPEQVQSPGRCWPVDPFSFANRDALIEIHSHHDMTAVFSGTDDKDESTGFRIYAVLGRISTQPEIRVRVGIYGHFWEIPAAWIFELPAGLADALYARPNDDYRYDPIEDVA